MVELTVVVVRLQEGDGDLGDWTLKQVAEGASKGWLQAVVIRESWASLAEGPGQTRPDTALCCVAVLCRLDARSARQY